MKRIPVTVLTGFLGAGKTTFLNRMMDQTGFGDTAVIVNEFGEAGVDGGLIERADERAFAMSTGCLCCTVSGDVRLTLLRILDQAEKGTGPSFSRVVIETTGLADPAPILQMFMSNDFMLSRFTLNGIVTLVDAVKGDDAIERYGEARRQIAVADLLILTKSDMARDPASQRDVIALKTRLTRLNPNAHLQNGDEATAGGVFSLAAFDPAAKPPDVRQWLRFETSDDHGHHDHSHHHDVNRHGDTASAFCFSAIGSLDPESLDKAIASLKSTFGPNLLRMKGLVEIDDYPSSPMVIHVVGHITSPPRMLDGWPAGMTETRIVLIVSGSNREAAPDLLKGLIPELRVFQPDV